LIIRLSPEQQHDLLEWSERITAAHVGEDCLPPGYELIVSVSSEFATAEARCGSQRLDLGDVDVSLEKPGSFRRAIPP
jgi:hypothetical protein